MIATGLHRAATAGEIRTIVGEDIASRYRIVNHDARDVAAHRYPGDTSRGTPVYVDEHFMAADLHITLGLIEPHLMLGFSGGRKPIAPGIAAQETINVIHAQKFMREEMAVEGSMQENPLHHELLEIARMARHDFIIDVTLTPSRKVSGVFAGNPEEAHASGVQFLQRFSVMELDEPVDAVITSAAGFPLDLTFYQTIKGITAAQRIVRPGGAILICSECSEGAGSSEFASMLRSYRGPQTYLDQIRETPVVADQWQLEKLALVELKSRLLLYTPGVPSDALGALGPRSYPAPQDAVNDLLARLPDNSRIAVTPEGPYASVQLKPTRAAESAEVSTV